LSRGAAVNVVDRPEPGLLDGHGDATVLKEDMFSSVPDIPRPEQNSNPGGASEMDFSKRRRTEGALANGGGNNLSDLTVASVDEEDLQKQAQAAEGEFSVAQSEFIDELNKGIGLEYSQQLRYLTYADSLRSAFRNALAEEFEEHAEVEVEHAQILSRRVVALGGTISFKVEAPIAFDPTDPQQVDKILSELWKREQAGLEYYRGLKKLCGMSIFLHTVEEILVTELEHNDDLVRFGLKKTAEVVPLPKDTQPSQWKDSYTDENQFEGLDKLGACANCGNDIIATDIHDCPLCSGREAILAKNACFNCYTSGKLGICFSCSAVYAVEPIWKLAKTARWLKRADAVKRKTMHGGLPIHIEYEAGDTKTYDNGNTRTYKNTYGFIPGTTGADGEPIDVYLGNYPSHQAHVISQMKPGRGYDEDKVMLGFSSPEQAEVAYRQHYPNNGDGHFGGMRSMGLESFINDYCQPEKSDPYKPKLMLKQVPIEVIAQQKVKVTNPQSGWVGWVNPENADKYEPASESEDQPNEFSETPSLADVDLAVKNVEDRSKLPADPFRYPPLPQDVEAAVQSAIGNLNAFYDANPSFKPPVDYPSVANINPSVSVSKEADSLIDSVVAATESKQAAEEILPQLQAAGTPASKMAEQVLSTLAKAPDEQRENEALKELVETSPLAARYTQKVPNAENNSPSAAEPDQAPAVPAKTDSVPRPGKPVVPGSNAGKRTPNSGGVSPVKPKEAPGSLPGVDTSEVISPVEQEWQRDRSKLKEIWSQMWKLIGGPGYQPGSYIKESAKRADMPLGPQPDQYKTPDTGPLGNDGDPDHPEEANVVTYA
jgi:bacterioferritin (cytochrome b1)